MTNKSKTKSKKEPKNKKIPVQKVTPTIQASAPRFLSFLAVMLLVLMSSVCFAEVGYDVWGKSVFDVELTGENQVYWQRGMLLGTQSVIPAINYLNPYYQDFLRNLSVPEYTKLEDLQKTIDEIYSDPANRSINYFQAYWLACIKIRDDDSNDFQFLRNVFRGKLFMPVYATVESVVDGNTIKIESEGAKYTVKLIGINPIGKFARAHLEKLIYKDLSKGKIELYYYHDLFDGEGRVLAEARGFFTKKNFNAVMIYDGYAKPSFVHDPKRSPGFTEKYEEYYQTMYNLYKEKFKRKK